METNTNNTAALEWDENAAVLPEGGWDATDVSSDEDDLEAARIADMISNEFDTQTPGTASEDSHDQAGEADAPTTEQTQEQQSDSDTEDAHTIEQALESAVAKNKIKFKAKVDHNVTDVELDDTELPTMYQKAHNYDRLSKRAKESADKMREVQELAAELGYDSVDEMIEATRSNNRAAIIEDITSKGNSEDVAAFVADARIKEARSKVSLATADEDDEADEVPAKAARNYKSEVADFLEAHPEYREKGKKLPQEVISAASKSGVTLRTAYAEWESKNTKAENARIAKERDLSAQRAEAATRSPVRGVTTGSASTKESARDPWMDGFTGKKWWE